MMRTSIRFGLLAASAVFALVLLATLPSQGAPAAQESPLSPLAAPAGEDALWTEYNAAVFDAAVYQSDHLRPLLPLVEDSDTPTVTVMTITASDFEGAPADAWARYGHRLLPECPNETVTSGLVIDYALPHDCVLRGDIWVTVVPEVQQICSAYADADDLDMRLRQLIGLPPDHPVTHLVEMTAQVDDVFRPSADGTTTTDYPCADPDTGSCGNVYPEDADAEHITWMANNTLFSYAAPGGYPWTRLGYTYNWRAGEDRYGASEYVVAADAEVTITRVVDARTYCEEGAE